MPGLSRRRFLGGAAAAASTWWLRDPLLGARAAGAVGPPAATVAPHPTTLSTSILPSGSGAYLRLTSGPGFAAVVRTLGAEASPRRAARRRPLATIVHLTDVHLIDCESPARVELLDRYADPPTGSIPFGSAYRPQEALTAQVAEAMVRRINAIAAGPRTGRRFDCAVSTGDAIDNQQRNELGWHLRLLDGGPLAPTSGDPARYEGVMDLEPTSYDVHYWHPDDERPDGDLYKERDGFPAAPGLLAASIQPFTATGLRTPWYATYGNHDGLVQGNSPANAALEAIATGPLKVTALPAGLSPGDLADGLARQDPGVLAALAAAPARAVTPDPLRAFATAADWVDAHLASPATPGPKGHGLTEAHRDGRPLFFTFEIAPGVLGVSLDTCARGGYAEGQITTEQAPLVEAALQAATAAGQLVVLFSHHHLGSMANPAPDPARPSAQPVSAAAFEELLHRFPHVVLWVSGHSHVNRVVPHARPGGGGGFFEVLTAAHVDWPQQSRIVELADNRDGTISIFGTLVDHAGPTRPTGLGDVLQLAAWSRELAVNDPQADLAALGGPEDRNVELVLPDPRAKAAAAPTTTRPGRVASTSAGAGAGGALPATGAGSGVALVAGAAALAGATAVAAARRAAVCEGGGEAGT